MWPRSGLGIEKREAHGVGIGGESTFAFFEGVQKMVAHLVPSKF